VWCRLYTADRMRFEVPLSYLGTTVFTEFLRMSQEEFGFTRDGQIILPFDSVVMDNAMCLLRPKASAQVEKAFLRTITIPCCYVGCVAPFLGVSKEVAVWSF
jgi:hypothetical protein